MKNIPCELIEDLLPVYADELTSPVTNEIVEEHLKNCDKCSQKYHLMKRPITEKSERDMKEIDFLKKTKKNNRKKLLLCAAVIWLMAVVFVGFSYYFSGSNMNTEYLSYHLDVSGTDLTVAVRENSKQGIQKIEINEEQGIVEITVRGVKKSFFFDNSDTRSFTATQEIRQVWIGDRIVWANGEMISPLTSNLYAVYNPYIGNMPSNGKIVEVLNMTAYTGGFKNELQTSREPYAWKMIFENDFSGSREEALETRLKMYSYLLLAQIGNLDEVIYEYTIDGEGKTLSVSSADASAFAGVDIKSVAQDINQLEKLVRKTELSNIVLGGAAVESNAQVDFSFPDQTEQVLEFTVVNYAEDDIYGMRLLVESEGMEAYQAMRSAENGALQNGLNVDFQLIPEDFGRKPEDGSKGKIRLFVTDKNGKETEAYGEVTIDLIWGTKYRVNVSGDAGTGYFLGK